MAVRAAAPEKSMRLIISTAWMLSTLFIFGGVAIAFCGVAIFGWHFIRANHRAAQDQVGGTELVAWGGAGAKQGFRVFAAGLLVHLSGFVTGIILSSLA